MIYKQSPGAEQDHLNHVQGYIFQPNNTEICKQDKSG